MNDSSSPRQCRLGNSRPPYGVERTIPIPVELRPVVEQYLFDRAVCLRAHRASSKALFFAMGGG